MLSNFCLFSFKFEIDSSNDEDLFADSSEEGSQSAFINVLAAEISDTILEPAVKEQDPLHSEVVTNREKGSTTDQDEQCVMRMDDGEIQFYDSYISGGSMLPVYDLVTLITNFISTSQPIQVT